MGVFSRALEVRAGVTSNLSNPSQWLTDWLGGKKSATGIAVNEQSAMQSSSIWSCVKILAESMANVPLPLYQRLDGGGKELAPEHPLYEILHNLPNPEMTSTDFRETMMTHLCLWGNAYAEIERDNANRVIALWPLRPDRMQIWRSPGPDFQLEYWYSLYTGGIQVLPPEKVLHIKLQSIDGIRGLSPIAHQREAVGLDLALERYAATLFGNGANAGGVLMYPGRVTPNMRKNITETWEANHKGIDNAHKISVLEEGVHWLQTTIPPDDAQFIASREYQLSDIARIYRVPLRLLMHFREPRDTEHEHLTQDFVVHTLRPYCVRWEQAIYQKLLLPQERSRYFAEFNLDGLLRGDIATRYTSYAVAKQWGFLNTDEIRDKENLNPLPDGKGQGYWTPVNMVDSNNPELTMKREPQPKNPPGQALDPGDNLNRGLLDAAMADKGMQILRKERTDILKSATKLLGKDKQAVHRWLDDYYEKHRGWIEERLALMKANVKAGTVEDYARRHAALSRSQIGKAFDLKDLGAIELVLNEWEADRSADFIHAFVGKGETRADANPPVVVTFGPDSIHNEFTTPAPTVTINEAPEGPTNVNINEGAVQNRVEVLPPPQNITVEPAQVTVNDQPDTITVQPAQVTVQPADVVVNVEQPPRGPVKVTYDRQGRVSGTEPVDA